jgi:hypothetical protein
MDRRNFLSQSFVTMGTYAISFSSFAAMDFGGLASLGLRPGAISQKEFEAAAHKAHLNNRVLILHPQTQVKVSRDLNISCSIVGNGGAIKVSKGAKLNFIGEQNSTLKVSGIKFHGEIVFKHHGDVKVSKNSFVNPYGDALVLDSNKTFELTSNTISSEAHGVVVLRNSKGLISSNKIEVKGSQGQYVWAENTFNLVVTDNTFKHSMVGNPTVGVANDHDLNPNITLRNNKLA